MNKARKNMQEIVDFYEKKDYMVTLCQTRKLKECKEILDFEKMDRIVCSGGDGTLNMIVSFFIKEKLDVAFAYLPAGSTNDFAYTLGIAEDMGGALEQTVSGTVQNIDVGCFNKDSFFLYAAAFGIFTKVAYTTSQKAKNLLGHTAYLLEGIKELSELKSYSIEMELEGEQISGEFILGLVTNSLSIAGIRNLLPSDTLLNDGKFEVILIKTPKNIGDLNGIVVSLLTEKPQENANIIYRKTDRLSVRSAESIAWTLDGEFGGEKEKVEIENLHGACKIIC